MTRSKSVHASLAGQSPNPIERMLHLLLGILQYRSSQRPELVLNIRDLISTPTGFMVPGNCKACLDIHTPPGVAIGELAVELEELLALDGMDGPQSLEAQLKDLASSQPAAGEAEEDCAQAFRSISLLEGPIQVKFLTVDSGYELPERGPIVQVLEDVFLLHELPWSLAAFPSHSDANQLWAAGMKPILLGCGDLGEAHTPDESLSLSQLATCSQLYLDLLLRLYKPSGA